MFTLSKNKKLVVSVAGVLLIISVLIFWSMRSSEEEIEILAEYPGKIVYTIDLSKPENVYEAHCEAAGGDFNACGTPCDPVEELCTAVCAYACEF